MESVMSNSTGAVMNGPGAVRRTPPAEKPANKSAVRPMEERLEAAPPARPYMLVFYLLVGVALFIGWRVSGEEHIVAESGTGYALGIIGGGMMLLLILYPVRKKARFMRNWGAVKYWFWAHMVMGILGPVIVVFHSNFTLGSTNSRVVLFTTILVAGSGLVGRYIYTKVHYGLYGRQMTLKELIRDMEVKKSSLAFVLNYAPKLQKRLIRFNDAALRPRYSFHGSLAHYLIMSVWARWTHLMLRMGLRRALKVAAARAGWSAVEKRRRSLSARVHISAHIKSALRIARFAVYERLIALWHLFHFPLFILLLIVAVVHVLAVHMY